MSDEPVRTRVKARGAWSDLQEFLIRERAAGPVQDVEFRGAADAEPTAQVLEALAAARAVVVGPSNPVISIGPILAVPGIRAALREAPAPVIAVSPFVGGHAIKGPTDDFCQSAGIELSAQGVADHYRDVLDAVVADEPVEGVSGLVTDTLMTDAAGRHALARKILDFAGSARSLEAG
jgi:LPPG:FO 2-phospho-L-lactate transferase